MGQSSEEIPNSQHTHQLCLICALPQAVFLTSFWDWCGGSPSCSNSDGQVSAMSPQTQHIQSQSCCPTDPPTPQDHKPAWARYSSEDEITCFISSALNSALVTCTGADLHVKSSGVGKRHAVVCQIPEFLPGQLGGGGSAGTPGSCLPRWSI